MANRILISLGEDVTEPVWFNNVEPFIQTVLQKLNYEMKKFLCCFVQMNLLKN